jgi:hypothetical protein
VIGCIAHFPPSLFSTPNLRDELLVYVCRGPIGDIPGTAGQGLPFCALQAPDFVDIPTAGEAVVNVSFQGASAFMTSVAPGETWYEEFVSTCDGRRIDCTPGGEVYPIAATVSPDLGGPWKATCTNGDDGAFSVPGWPSVIGHHSINEGAEAGSGLYQLFGRETEQSCFESKDGLFSCSARAGAGSVFNEYPNPDHDDMPAFACTAARPCYGAITLANCGASRHTGAIGIMGPDTLSQGDCTIVRGGSGMCAMDAGADAAADATPGAGTPDASGGIAPQPCRGMGDCAAAQCCSSDGYCVDGMSDTQCGSYGSSCAECAASKGPDFQCGNLDLDPPLPSCCAKSNAAMTSDTCLTTAPAGSSDFVVDYTASEICCSHKGHCTGDNNSWVCE